MALDINAVWERSAGATSYKVGVRVNSGAWTEYTVTNNSFNLSGFSLNDFVEARVRGVNNAGQSEWTDIDSVTILGALPTPLSGLTATGIYTGIRLDWNDNADNETGYRIYRSDGGGGTADTWTWSLIHTTAPSITTYNDALTTGVAEYYIVIGVSLRGTNPTLANSYTSYVTAVAGVLPNAPSNLVATPASTSRIDLSWVDNSTNETGFSIYRKKSGEGSFILIGDVVANITTYSDTGLDAGTEYSYFIRAYNQKGNSDPSAIDSATTTSLPLTTPSGLSAVEVPVRQVYASWDSVSGAVNYRIRFNLNDGSWIESAALYVTEWQSGISFKAGSQIDVQVRAENSLENSAWSGTSRVIIPT